MSNSCSSFEDDLSMDESDREQTMYDSDDEQNPKQDTSKSIKLSNAITKILESESCISTKKPILSQDKSIEKSLANHKLELKAKKVLAQEKKKWMNKERVIPQIEGTAEHEKILRKTATRGVVQLFNAIKAAQKKIEESSNKKSLEKAMETKSEFLKMLS